MSSMNQKSTIQMMKLFQENVKKDISNTNSVIKLVQEKLKDCDFNLNSLKQISKELNLEFSNIESKVNNLNITFKKQNSSSGSSLSRNSSLSSLTDNLNENNLNEALALKSDDSEDIENTYIYVTLNQDGTSVEEINWTKRTSISSTGSSQFSSDENSNDSSDFQASESIEMDKQVNERLIRMLLQNSNNQ